MERNGWSEIADLANEVHRSTLARKSAAAVARGDFDTARSMLAETDDLGTVAELAPRSVTLTLAELRALDDVIQVGARALIAQRGAIVPSELASAQRKVQSAYVTYPRSARIAEIDAAHARH